MIYSVVLVSGVQQSDSVMYIHISTLFYLSASLHQFCFVFVVFEVVPTCSRWALLLQETASHTPPQGVFPGEVEREVPDVVASLPPHFPQLSSPGSVNLPPSHLSPLFICRMRGERALGMQGGLVPSHLSLLGWTADLGGIEIQSLRQRPKDRGQTQSGCVMAGGCKMIE